MLYNLNLRPKDILLFIALFVISCVLLCSVTSCNTVHKTMESVKSNTDSVHVVKADSVRVTRSDSSGQKSESGSYEKETITEYEAFKDTSADGKVTYSYVPKQKRETEKGNYQKQETAQQSNYDSSAAHEIDSAMKHQEIKAVATQTQSSRTPIGLIIGAVFAFVAVVALVLLFIYLKRK